MANSVETPEERGHAFVGNDNVAACPCDQHTQEAVTQLCRSGAHNLALPKRRHCIGHSCKPLRCTASGGDAAISCATTTTPYSAQLAAAAAAAAAACGSG